MGAQRVELGAEGAELGLERLDLQDDARGVVAALLLRERPPDPLDRPRRWLRRSPLPALFESDDAVADGDLAEDSALRLDVAAAVATLDERNRELIALRYGADLTAKQIAELLGVKTNAVEVALHRALGRLKVLLDPSHPDGGALRPKATETQALDS